MMRIAEKFREAMLVKGLKIPDLARQMGMSQSFVYDLFAGKRRWNETTIEKACEALDVKLEVVAESSHKQVN